MKFCPFLSTNEKKVECSKDCMIYRTDDDDNPECGILHLANSLDWSADRAGYLANAIWNNS